MEQRLVTFSYKGAERRKVRGGDRVAILGDGKLGLCVAEILGREYLSCIASMEDDTQQQLTRCLILFRKHRHKLDLVAESRVQTLLVQE